MRSVLAILNQLSDKQLKQLACEFKIKVKSNHRTDLILSLLKPRQIGGFIEHPVVEFEDEELINDLINEDEDLINEDEDLIDEDNIDTYFDQGLTDPDVLNQLQLERDRQIIEFNNRKTVLEAIYDRAEQGLIEFEDENENENGDIGGDEYDLRGMSIMVHAQLADLERIQEFDMNDQFNLNFGAQYLTESEDEYERLKSKYYLSE